MTKRYLLLLFAVTILTMAGCAGKTIINVDGMPISNHEYNLTNQETKIRAVFVLARYYREYEGDEYIIKPEYLDALHAEKVDAESTEQLIFHIKIVNVRKKFFAVNWEISGPKSQHIIGHVYSGNLSRKDFYIKLPLVTPGDYTYELRLTDEEGDDLFDLPQMRYKLKGGMTRTKL